VCFPVWMSSYTNVHLVWLSEKLVQYKYSTKYYNSIQYQYVTDGTWWNYFQNPRENVDTPLLLPLGYHRDKEKEQQQKGKKSLWQSTKCVSTLRDLLSTILSSV
jgi:hypothetical protein